jgi:hypothetical protein
VKVFSGKLKKTFSVLKLKKKCPECFQFTKSRTQLWGSNLFFCSEYMVLIICSIWNY